MKHRAAERTPDRARLPGPFDRSDCVAVPRSHTNIFEFQDYREYLKAFYRAEKEASSTFSYRAFSQRAGLSSPNHLKRIIDGERSLTAPIIARYAKVLRLTKNEGAYLEALVEFTDAANNRARDDAYRKLLAFRQYQQAHHLDSRQAEYHALWYVPAIRELARRADFENNPAWVAERLRPKISIAEAKAALRTLFELGLLTEERGRVVQTDAVVTTRDVTRDAQLGRFHRQMLEHAARSIDHFPASDRDISCLTCCFDAGVIDELKARAAEFRRELIALSEASKTPAQVMQINLQIFPLSSAMPTPRKKRR